VARYQAQWPLIGHELPIAQLTAALNAGRLRHAYLIAGIDQIGKTAFATAFAQTINCVSDSGRPCGQCRPCRLIAAGTHIDLTTLEGENEDGGYKIEQIRNLSQQLALRPGEARYKVVVLRNFDAGINTGPAMDAFLKTLEEPPPHILLLLTANNPNRILATIRSRVQTVNLRPLPAAQIRQALQGRDLSEEQLALVSQLAAGRVAWAINYIQDRDSQLWRVEQLALLERLLAMRPTARLSEIEQLQRRDDDELAALLSLWQSYWRDALLLACHAATPITNRDHRHALDQIARHAGPDGCLKVLLALRRTLQYLEERVNQRMTLDVLMLDMPALRLLAPPPGYQPT
jgi:DNA polymerase III subunit delta'